MSNSYYFILIVHILRNLRFINHSAAWLQPFLLHHNDSVIGAVFLFLIQDEIRVWLFIETNSTTNFGPKTEYWEFMGLDRNSEDSSEQYYSSP